MATTVLSYFDDTYKFVDQAKVLQIIDSSSPPDPSLIPLFSKHSAALVLDHTLFYPQGGGQPTDIGTIASQSGSIFNVKHVGNHNGTVYHLGSFADQPFDSADDGMAQIRVDEQTRLANARCHSGGHVIFSVIKNSGWPMAEKKGHHFADGAYVEFEGLMPESVSKEDFQKTIDDVVSADLPVSVTTVEGQDENSPMRFVQVGDFVKNACGGTHVRSTAELGRIVIKKIARRKGQNVTKVSYAIEQKA
ncbi:hypothetical protein H4R99_005129 [Coemansia sp. RSA 1722]|nr:hypothetical protein LPJ57_001745 [Coemansia sp. RSA 486]KAJ2595933.1 hypothetical protein H4R99_005129 [Coemansia sp. RSA 1722]KAJ2600775.1 hypothetical protein GGF39_001612 [Coemansia sp. RSA 1721]